MLRYAFISATKDVLTLKDKNGAIRVNWRDIEDICIEVEENCPDDFWGDRGPLLGPDGLLYDPMMDLSLTTPFLNFLLGDGKLLNGESNLYMDLGIYTGLHDRSEGIIRELYATELPGFYGYESTLRFLRSEHTCCTSQQFYSKYLNKNSKSISIDEQSERAKSDTGPQAETRKYSDDEDVIF